MSTTALLGLPLIDAAQSQKHITHNEALLLLDACVHLSALSRQVPTPPAAPAEGDRYLVPAGATGVFASQTGRIALWQSGAWGFLPARAGWRLYVADENRLIVYDGSNWTDPQIALTAIQNLTLLGIGTVADPSNPLSVKANAGLFTARSAGEGGTGDLRCVLNKSAAANTVSQLYQDNYSGRAETGLTGDDNFHVKVSPDGSSWHEAINIDCSSGKVTFPSGTNLSGAGSYTLPAATPSALGGVKPSTGLTVAADGTLVSAMGFRNRLINGRFVFNQRNYASGTATTIANQYTLDRWRVVVAGQAISWTSSGIDNVVTAPAGGVEQVIEGLNIEGGTYTLSWVGTATATISGAAVANGGQVVLAAGANATLRFSSGTVSQAQIEPGTLATPFERRPFGLELALCQRYYQQFINTNGNNFVVDGYGAAGSYVDRPFLLGTAMRGTPTFAFIGTWPLVTNLVSVNGYGASPGQFTIFVQLGSTTGGFYTGNPPNGGFSLSAEL